MDHYLDIRLRPDPEFIPHQLMDALFAKLHRTLVRMDSQTIGVSFPDARGMRTGIGSCLRVHGAEQALAQLMAQPWLTGMTDHVICSATSVVPTGASHQQVHRIQPKGASDLRRLRKRRMERTGCSEDEARAAIPDSATDHLTLPFLTVRSSSTAQSFRLFIQQKPASQATDGSFNTYGLSTTATLPLF